MMASKPKKQRPLPIISAVTRAAQFPDTFYADGGVMFCRHCSHSVDYTRSDTVKDHLKSKKHLKNKELKSNPLLTGSEQGPTIPAAAARRQTTLHSTMKSKDLREEFILDFVKCCTMADIPLHKVENMRPFILKHCKQGGALPKAETLRHLYIPRQFKIHLAALKEVVKGAKVSVIADETTDIRDHSILNVIVGVRGKYYLIDVCTMEACNHATLSQAVVKALTNMDIKFDDVIAIVTDSAAYCKKAAREVLTPLLPNSRHVPCLAHIINLGAEAFQHYPEFGRVDTFTKMMKSAFFKKPARKTRYLKYLKEYLPPDQCKLAPAPVSTRWNSWYNAVKYHKEHLHVYEGFFKLEDSKGVAVETILEMLRNKEIYSELELYMSFITEYSARLTTVLTSLEATKKPLACTVYNILEDTKTYLTTERTSFDQINPLMEKRPAPERQKLCKTFNKVFKAAADKITKHLDQHPAMPFYKAARIFDPRQLVSISLDIDDYQHAIPDLTAAAIQTEEWLMYTHLNPSHIPEPLNLTEFWKSMSVRFPGLASIAMDAMWMPVSSVDVERSFSQYKHILDDKRENLTPENTKMMTMLYYNADVERQF
ncbi:uncharacterized protein LOC121428390 [Lytechinus variegatus]|uniref:uncharacterized protein LOC121428390 n=1 Tax=Lytechinus variegatus TaxID=7654 RepID=UPI001BB0E3F3|nr:uncharacterized protein LOC121428390 [Lytechinus variegatus]